LLDINTGIVLSSSPHSAAPEAALVNLRTCPAVAVVFKTPGVLS
jgi:hypothetical protein